MNCGFNFAVLYVVNLLVMEYKSPHKLKKQKQENGLSQSWLIAKTINEKFWHFGNSWHNGDYISIIVISI